jgi:hypothetical protein
VYAAFSYSLIVSHFQNCEPLVQAILLWTCLVYKLYKAVPLHAMEALVGREDIAPHF